MKNFDDILEDVGDAIFEGVPDRVGKTVGRVFDWIFGE